jgi:4-hydroxyphenylpyruvate dioxygenase-like putative hemolysin
MDLFENPMGTDGFEFVEYTAPDSRALATLFENLGFSAVARHRSKDVTLPPGRYQLHRQPRTGQLCAVLRPRARAVRVCAGHTGEECGGSL